MFIIHLVPLVLGKNICMQEKSQKWTNKEHRRQMDVAGGPGPIGPSRPTPCGIGRCHRGPCHITDPCEGLHTASPTLIHVGLIQGMMLSCQGSLGPPSFTWEAQTNLQTTILTMVTDLPACNHRPEAIHRCWMVRRCNGRSADRAHSFPMPPCLSTSSSSPTSTPMPSLHTIIGVVVFGGDHHSSIPSSPRSSQE